MFHAVFFSRKPEGSLTKETCHGMRVALIELVNRSRLMVEFFLWEVRCDTDSDTQIGSRNSAEVGATRIGQSPAMHSPRCH
mmetsp:Transcript_14525/g.29677  ORF Transcript_14525/g.29677 Transcript_14525/m.29677 type:complete len:81 (-) Transcript_14525:1660-1902(-)